MAFGGAVSLLALIAIDPGATAAPARPFAIPVDFDAPAGCSDADAFRRGVGARLARSAVAAEVAVGTRLQIRLTRAGAKVLGQLRLVHAQGVTETRRVEGASCDEVVEVLALTVALALETSAERVARAPDTRPPTATGRGAAPSPANPPTTGAAPAPPPPPPAVPAASPPAPDEIRPTPPRPPPATAPAAPIDAAARGRRVPSGLLLEAGAGAALARVVTSGFNLGGALMLGVTRGGTEDGVAPSLRLALLYLPSDFLLPAGDVAATWSALALGVCPGWGLRRGAFDAQACARGVGGWLAATDRAVNNPRAAGRTWWSAGAFLRAAAALGAGFSVELEAGVDGILIERRFITTTPLRTVAETPPVSVLVGLGLSRRL